ncbi:MAG: DNA-directed RNA polymerase subunit beta', partial [Chloroflexi bacterium]|nr:DNA-directed RNA polymerase subunit beta' [Chloroflexota bacterium]
HPLVCTAFNADFDGDQMAVHVPLSREAVFEAKELMLSANNLLSPASGEPVVTPTLDLVLGIYYLTSSDPQAIGHDRRFGSVSEALLACDLGLIRSQASIQVLERDIEGASGRWIITTAGRLIFREVLPKELTDDPANWNRTMDKKAIKDLVTTSYHLLGAQATAAMLDSFKKLGFHYATLSGTSIGIHDLEVPERKKELVAKAERQIQQLEEQYQGGLVSEKERYEQAIRIWTEASDTMTKVIEESLPTFGGIFTIAASGAKGNISQITQMAGMRGLMSDPKGRLIEVPVRSSFREGLSVLEYFISTHGARKGLADTALRTADSGYLTRRMVDVAQDMIILEEDCGTTLGSWIRHDQEKEKNNYIATFRERLVGRYAAEPIADPSSGEILVGRNEEIGEDMAARIWDQGIREVYVRSPLTCEARRGLCAPCYGRMPASGKLAQVGEAVGVVAAESIGEPGTQLTMRTFHTGGVSGVDITSGIPRVEGLFEARVPKNCAILAEIDGMVTIAEKPEGWQLQLVSAEEYREEYPILPKYRVVVKKGEVVEAGTPLAVPRQAAKKAEPTKKAKTKASSSEIQPAIVAKVAGRIELTTGKIAVVWQERDERVYLASMTAHILVKSGDAVKAGQELTAGPKDPHDILRIQGREAVEQYIIEEIQKVYRSQGVSINDKHIEIIIRQMLRRVRVDYAGDTDLLPDDLVDRIEFEDINRRILAQGGEPARATPRLLGITRSSLNTDSFLAAASFQETTRVLTEAALNGQIDRLHGLKENVILGRLLPARYPIPPDVKPWGDGKDKEPLAIASTATALDDEGASAQMLATLELPSDE